MNAYFSRNDPIDKPRNFTMGTRSDIALLDSRMRYDAYSSIANIKKKGKNALWKVHSRFYRDRYCCGRYLLFRYLSSRTGID